MPLTPETQAELLSLLPAARAARRQHGPDTPQGAATRRVNEILGDSVSRGDATVRELSDLTGISYHSVARRVRIAQGNPPPPRKRRPRPAPAPEPPAPATGVVEPTLPFGDGEGDPDPAPAPLPDEAGVPA